MKGVFPLHITLQRHSSIKQYREVIIRECEK